MKRKSLVLLLLAALLVVVFYFFDPLQYAFFPKCPFKLLTGYNCPGCGFQRAVHSLLHGDVIQAIKYNIFLVISMPYLLSVIVANYCLPEEKKKKVLSVVEGKYLAMTYVALFFIWLFVRNYYNI